MRTQAHTIPEKTVLLLWCGYSSVDVVYYPCGFGMVDHALDVAVELGDYQVADFRVTKVG